MKKLLFLLITLSLWGCYSIKYREVQLLQDFRPYIDKGFYISPLSTLTKEYDVLGNVGYLFIIGLKDGYKNPNYTEAVLFGQEHIRYVYIPEYDYMVQKTVDYAKELGADGIINFKITPQYKYYSGKFNVVSFESSGVAINIK